MTEKRCLTFYEKRNGVNIIMVLRDVKWVTHLKSDCASIYWRSPIKPQGMTKIASNTECLVSVEV